MRDKMHKVIIRRMVKSKIVEEVLDSEEIFDVVFQAGDDKDKRFRLKIERTGIQEDELTINCDHQISVSPTSSNQISLKTYNPYEINAAVEEWRKRNNL